MAGLKQRMEDAGAKLHAAKIAVEQAQAEWDDLFKQAVSGRRKDKVYVGEPIEDDEVTDFILTNRPVESSALNQIANVLNSNTEKEWDYAEISASLPGIPRPSIRVSLYRLQHDQKAIKTGRGKWKAAPQRVLNFENIIQDVLSGPNGLGKSERQIVEETHLTPPQVSQILHQRREMFIQGSDNLWRKKG